MKGERPDETGRARWLVIFTDLDGTLLDYDGYSWAAAGEALAALRAAAVPLVFCSSKTRAEQELHQEILGVWDPMIVENGSAVVTTDGEPVVLGVRRDRVLEALAEMRRDTEVTFRGYADMTTPEVAALTGLSAEAAARARMREYSETVHVEGDHEAWRRFCAALEARGLHTWGSGPIGTVVGAGADKGRAVTLVTERYRQVGPVTTVGLGDGANDEPMLAAVDRPFLVERRGGGWTGISVPGLERVEGVGPLGWARAVERVLKEVSPS